MKKSITILLILTMFISLFSGCSKTENVESQKIDVSETPKTEKNVVTETKPSMEVEGAKITFSVFDIEKELEVNISKVSPSSLNFDEEITEEYLLDVYDFNVLGAETFTDLMEIRLDYDDTFMDEGSDESGSVFAMYYNPETNTWETVDYWVDTQNNQVVITTSHLSKYGVFTVKNENTRLAYIGRVNSYVKIVDSEMAQDILNEAIKKPTGEVEKAVNLGMNVMNDWLGLSGFLLTTSNPVYSSGFLDGLGSTFNGLGVAAAIAQVAVDFQSGNGEALYGNLSKNILNIAVGNWGTSALQLSFAGVFAIDYSLNKFATAAWDGRNEIWYDAYNLHYKEKMKLTHRKWYSKFYWIWQDSLKEKDPQYLKTKINEAIEANVTAFWEDEEEMAFYQGEVMNNGSTGGGGLNNSLIKEITDVKRAELVKSLQPVFNQLEKKISYYLRDEYRKKLEAAKREFNKVVKVTIEEVVPDGMKSNYAGYIVKFAPLNDKANEKTWTGKLNKKGSARTKFTILGHMQSGQPNTIELYNPNANVEIDEPEKVIEFNITGTELNIKLGQYPPLEEIIGAWPGTFYFKSVKVPALDTTQEENPESCDGLGINLETILAGLKEHEGKTVPSVINIVQTGENSGYFWFGDEPDDLDEDEKLYFDYQYGQIKLNKSEDGFSITMNLMAMYMDEKKISLSGPVKLSGMNGQLEVDIVFESER